MSAFCITFSVHTLTKVTTYTTGGLDGLCFAPTRLCAGGGGNCPPLPLNYGTELIDRRFHSIPTHEHHGIVITTNTRLSNQKDVCENTCPKRQ